MGEFGNLYFVVVSGGEKGRASVCRETAEEQGFKWVTKKN
jgi:hypothetical protein